MDQSRDWTKFRMLLRSHAEYHLKISSLIIHRINRNSKSKVLFAIFVISRKSKSFNFSWFISILYSTAATLIYFFVSQIYHTKLCDTKIIRVGVRGTRSWQTQVFQASFSDESGHSIARRGSKSFIDSEKGNFLIFSISLLLSSKTFPPRGTVSFYFYLFSERECFLFHFRWSAKN